MDFLLEALPELQETVFFSVANLLNLEVDLLFFDTSSTYWETDRLAEEIGVDEELVEAGVRAYSKHSKDHRSRNASRR